MRLVPASLVHVGWLSRHMRAIDRRECEAFGRSPKSALRMSLATSFHALTAIEDGKPIAMLGVTPTNLLNGEGSPWLLGTDGVFDRARELLTLGPKVFAYWHETFPVMENLVSSENVKAIALLKRWGATIIDEPQMIRGVEFVPFRIAAIQGVEAAA